MGVGNTNTQKANVSTVLKRNLFLRSLKSNITGYLFISPWLLGFLALTVWPMGYSFYLAFTDYSLFGSPAWIGLKNYTDIFTKDRTFIKSITVTFSLVLIAVPLKMIFSLLVAVLLNRDMKAMSFYRTAFYLPSLIGGSVAVSVLWRNMFGIDGYINNILGIFGVDKIPWIAHPDFSLKTIMILYVWQFGSTMIIFLAGLKQIPLEMYESASIDGAGNIRKFFNITLPMLSPVIFFNLILGVIGGFQQFNASFIITKGGPAYSTYLYAMMLYEKAFVQYKMGYAAGLAWVLLVVIAVLTLLNFLMSKLWVFYDDAGRG